ncbi:pyrroloquinoline quinone biosynthesis peptide chaperone PqqD, partial [Xanthomonas sp. Kuri4-3]
QHDRVRDQWVLLAPERVIELDETARQVVQRFDGERSLAQIAQALAQEFDAPVAEIEADVIELAATLGHKRVLRP